MYICKNNLNKMEHNDTLIKHDEQNFIDFFVQHPDFFIDIISMFYPLNVLQIEKYKDKWNWGNLYYHFR